LLEKSGALFPVCAGVWNCGKVSNLARPVDFVRTGSAKCRVDQTPARRFDPAKAFRIFNPTTSDDELAG
jgi:hypothetical protein